MHIPTILTTEPLCCLLPSAHAEVPLDYGYPFGIIYLHELQACLPEAILLYIGIISIYIVSEEFCLVSLSFTSLFPFCLTRL